MSLTTCSTLSNGPCPRLRRERRQPHCGCGAWPNSELKMPLMLTVKPPCPHDCARHSSAPACLGDARAASTQPQRWGCPWPLRAAPRRATRSAGALPRCGLRVRAARCCGGRPRLALAAMHKPPSSLLFSWNQEKPPRSRFLGTARGMLQVGAPLRPWRTLSGAGPAAQRRNRAPTPPRSAGAELGGRGLPGARTSGFRAVASESLASAVSSRRGAGHAPAVRRGTPAPQQIAPPRVGRGAGRRGCGAQKSCAPANGKQGKGHTSYPARYKFCLARKPEGN
jgi:hypothetical protein